MDAGRRRAGARFRVMTRGLERLIRGDTDAHASGLVGAPRGPDTPRGALPPAENAERSVGPGTVRPDPSAFSLPGSARGQDGVRTGDPSAGGSARRRRWSR